ncbi:MAG TPA: phospholipid carrier-dependent glycosyltransferase [Candidatus Saccharimonadia bacterium]
MNTLRRWRFDLILLFLAAFGTRLWHLFQPAAVVFDEVYFKVYAGDYLTHSYYFDPHPPLGKLILGIWAWLFHLDPANLTSTDQASVALRLLPALAGALIVPVFYVFLRQLKASRRTALLGAGLLLLENALIVESRFVLIDSLLVLFGLSAITVYLYARRFPAGWLRTLLIGAAAFLAGLSASIKWTGLTALALMGFMWAVDQWRFGRRRRWRWALAEALSLIFVPALVYLGVFFAHFQLLTHTGQGDAFMSTKFQATLQGSAYYDPQARLSFIDKFVELNQEMVRSEDSLKNATHPYGSRWFSWPMEIRDVYYWQGQTDSTGRQGNIYLLGNPVVWWSILLIVPLVLVVLSGNYHAAFHHYRFPLAILSIGYVINFLPFSRIVRVMFLYHYFFALIYSLALAMLLLQIVFEQYGRLHGRQRANRAQLRFYTVLGLATLAGFLYFAPLTYGSPLSTDQLQARMWLKTWR